MSTTARYIFIGIATLVVAFLLWYFKNIVAYILAGSVLSLLGKPLVDFLGKLHYKNIVIPKAFRALITLITLWIIIFTFFRIFIPLVANQANELSEINVQEAILSLDEPISRLEELINRYQLTDEKFDLELFITEKLNAVLNISIVSNIFSSLASILGNIFIAVFAISFITFFFLKDQRMLGQAILAAVPDKHEDSFKHALSSTKRLLMRYFIGICGQITGIITLVTIGLTIVGVDFSRSLVIGLIAGMMNVIPYLGPVIGSTIGIVLGTIGFIELDFYTEVLPKIGFMLVVFVGTQVTDNVVFQPFIFSNSVNAHPLEIFLVIMIAGSLAGVTGMILAIPTYTAIRVFLKEFFNKFKIVKKLTRNIE
jgi:predicted PurR-regulated permease PerM